MKTLKWEKLKTAAGTPYWVERATGRFTAVNPEDTKGAATAQRAQCCDLVQLPEDMINPKGITALLAMRYQEDNVYTWAGASHTVLVAINPFKALSIYTPGRALEFLNAKEQFGAVGSGEVPPHTFAVATNAFNSLRQGNQALLISGESGAGKTETTKHCLTLIAEATCDNGVGNLEQRVLSANPVLEAYGNASTTANDNSSRFGKWIKLMFSRDGELTGARIETYLLEKSRVAIHNEGERGFHIFYQLAANRDLLPAEYQLEDAEDFRYLSPEKLTRVDDAAAWEDVQNSLDKLGFRDDEVAFLWRTAAAVMHLGQLNFEAVAGTDGSNSKITSGPLALIANLLGVESNMLAEALTSKAIEVRGEVTWSPVAPGDARMSADALARTLHGETFRWLVQRINESLQGQAEAHRFIGILDIFGFEIFELNSFEQLCINFVNEKLQEHFNGNTFMEEQGLYKAEGIPFTSLEFVDNHEVLHLLEGDAPSTRGTVRGSTSGSVGLLPLLDDMCRVPNGSERGFLDKCFATFRSCKSFHPPKRDDDVRFTIQHYAGAVTYNVAGFMDKNRDQTMFGHLRLLRSSHFELLSGLVPTESPDRAETRQSIKKAAPTAAANLRKQLGELMGTIRACSAKYIRCIKPNVQKVPKSFDAVYSEEQLRYGGVFETVNIRKRGLPFRIAKNKFVKSYSCICLNHPLNPMKTSDAPWAGMRTDPSAASREILKYVGAHEGVTDAEDPTAAAVGTTIVFYRTEVNSNLELLRELALESYALQISRALRRYLGKVFVRVATVAKTAVESSLSMPDDLQEAILAVDKADAPVLQLFKYAPPKLQEVIQLRDDLQERASVAAEMSDVLKVFDEDVDGNARKLMMLLGRSGKLDKKGVARSHAQTKLVDDVKKIVKIHGARVLERQVSKACQLPVRPVLEELVRVAAAIEYEGNAMKEVHELLELSEVDFTKLQLDRANNSGQMHFTKDLRIRLVQLKTEITPESYALKVWPLTRNAQAWYAVKNMPRVRTSMKTKGRSASECEACMTTFQDWPIHASILEKTTIYQWHKPPESGQDKLYNNHDARVLFRNVMGYMGDRRHPYPDTLAVELVNNAVGSLSLASETFAQVIKQLTNNPTPASIERGWQLMALLLNNVAPSSEEECDLVAGFIWLNAPATIRLTLLDRLFEQSTRERRSATLIDLSSIPQLTKDLWSRSGGRPSLKLPRGSRLFSGLEAFMASCD